MLNLFCIKSIFANIINIFICIILLSPLISYGFYIYIFNLIIILINSVFFSNLYSFFFEKIDSRFLLIFCGIFFSIARSAHF